MLGICRNRILVVFVACFVEYCCSKRCVDNVHGVCEANDLFGWCFYNKKSGEFNCDTEKYCAKQSQIRAKLTAYGCFNRSETEVNCCCNEASMCNYQFIDETIEFEDVTEELPHSQSCSFQYSVENTEYRYNSCQDPWCLTLLMQNISAEGFGREESTIRGCQSWLLHRAMEVQENAKPKPRVPAYANLIKILLKQPRCRAIVDPTTPIINGSQQACIDFSFKNDGGQKRAKLCCCRGLNECNQNVSWIDEGRLFNSGQLRRGSWTLLSLAVSLVFLFILVA